MSSLFITNQLTDIERVILNRICEGKLLSKLSKDEVIAELIFSQAVSLQTWESTFDNLISVFEKMTDDDWTAIKREIPLSVSYSFGTYCKEDNRELIP